MMLNVQIQKLTMWASAQREFTTREDVFELQNAKN